MKNITVLSIFVVLLLQCAALSSSTRSSRRSSPPAPGDSPLLTSFNSLNGSLTAGPADPELKILSRVPYNEEIGGLTMRITSLKAGRFISSFNILPCIVDMLSTAFNAIWNEVEQHPQLHDHRFMCSENGLSVTVLSEKPPLKSMEYSDIVYLARILLNFQQKYRLPAFRFEYLEDGQKTGTGEISWNRATGSTQNLEQV